MVQIIEILKPCLREVFGSLSYEAGTLLLKFAASSEERNPDVAKEDSLVRKCEKITR